AVPKPDSNDREAPQGRPPESAHGAVRVPTAPEIQPAPGSAQQRGYAFDAQSSPHRQVRREAEFQGEHNGPVDEEPHSSARQDPVDTALEPRVGGKVRR